MSVFFKINDGSLDRFYNDIFAELTPISNMKYLELYGTPFQFNHQFIQDLKALGNKSSIIA